MTTIPDTNTPITFKATWHPGTEYLQIPDETTTEYIKRIAYNIISVVIPIIGLIRIINYFFDRYALAHVLPATLFPGELYEETENEFKKIWTTGPLGEHYSLNPISVETADNVELSGHFIKHKYSNDSTPTVLIFQPNAVPSKYTAWWRWLAEESVKMNEPCNFIIFDYRQTGESKGTVNRATDLIKDGDAMLQFARKKLEIPDDNLSLYTFSVGGIVSAETLACNPDFRGKYISDRSLRSISALVRARLPYTGKLVAFLSKGKWELDALEACKKMNAKRLVLYHPRDPVIPPSASIAVALKENPYLSANDIIIELQSPVYNEHAVPLTYCLARNSTRKPTEQILDFIFKSSLERRLANAG